MYMMINLSYMEKFIWSSSVRLKSNRGYCKNAAFAGYQNLTEVAPMVPQKP